MASEISGLFFDFVTKNISAVENFPREMGVSY